MIIIFDESEKTKIKAGSWAEVRHALAKIFRDIVGKKAEITIEPPPGRKDDGHGKG